MLPSSPTVLGTQSYVDDFAREGLRTLVLAYKELTHEEVTSYLTRYEHAITSLENRNQMLEEVYASIEHTFTLIGSSAIEDRLQPGVHETIHFMR